MLCRVVLFIMYIDSSLLTTFPLEVSKCMETKIRKVWCCVGFCLSNMYIDFELVDYISFPCDSYFTLACLALGLNLGPLPTSPTLPTLMEGSNIYLSTICWHFTKVISSE